MVERDLVPHAALLARFRSAADRLCDGADAVDLKRCVRHLHQVERDMFIVPESDIEVPPWADE